MCLTTFFVWILFGNVLLAQNVSPFIHVDQFGYLPNSSKVAVLSDPQTGYNANLSFSPSHTLELRKASNDSLIFSGTPVSWNTGATHQQSGDKGWWFDFSAVSAEGDYYILDPSSNEKSATFSISRAVYTEVLKAAGRMFYYNRCNADKPATFAGKWSDGNNFDKPLQDANCRFIDDPSNAALEKELSGGWFDAGDYNKYVTFTHSTLHHMLSAYEESPNAFADNWNIPESGNGIPDILDEIMWELNWLFKMTNADGSVQIKMGSQNHSENSSSPPSANSDQRFYGPTCSSASITVASVFAHAAKVFKGTNDLFGYGLQLEQTAISCFNYSKTFVDNNSFETDCDDGSIVAGDADQNPQVQLASFVTAAIYLFEMTGDSSYNNYVVNNYASLEQIQSGFWGPYFSASNEALVLYSQLPSGDATTSTNISNSFSQAVINDYNDFFGFSDNDLYRAQMPDWSYHWGSSNAKASYGILNSLALRSSAQPSANPSFAQYMDDVIHYFHGVNPQGLVYLSNMYAYGAERSVNEIYHIWFADGTVYDHAQTSSIGPAPGFVSGGPNKDFSVASLSPPSGQPIQKSYKDFNDSWPNNSWEISEPAIYYQAAYLRLLANRVDAFTGVSTHTQSSLLTQHILLQPNPTSGRLRIKSGQAIERVEVLSIQGKVVYRSVSEDGELDLSALPAGMYFVRVNGGRTMRLVKK